MILPFLPASRECVACLFWFVTFDIWILFVIIWNTLYYIIMDDRRLATWLRRFCVSGILSRCVESNKIALDVTRIQRGNQNGFSEGSVAWGKKEVFWYRNLNNDRKGQHRLIYTYKKQYQSRDIPSPVVEGTVVGNLINRS